MRYSVILNTALVLCSSTLTQAAAIRPDALQVASTNTSNLDRFHPEFTPKTGHKPTQPNKGGHNPQKHPHRRPIGKRDVVPEELEVLDTPQRHRPHPKIVDSGEEAAALDTRRYRPNPLPVASEDAIVLDPLHIHRPHSRDIDSEEAVALDTQRHRPHHKTIDAEEAVSLDIPQRHRPHPKIIDSEEEAIALDTPHRHPTHHKGLDTGAINTNINTTYMARDHAPGHNGTLRQHHPNLVNLTHPYHQNNGSDIKLIQVDGDERMTNDDKIVALPKGYDRAKGYGKKKCDPRDHLRHPATTEHRAGYGPDCVYLEFGSSPAQIDRDERTADEEWIDDFEASEEYLSWDPPHSVFDPSNFHEWADIPVGYSQKEAGKDEKVVWDPVGREPVIWDPKQQHGFEKREDPATDGYDQEGVAFHQDTAKMRVEEVKITTAGSSKVTDSSPRSSRSAWESNTTNIRSHPRSTASVPRSPTTSYPPASRAATIGCPRTVTGSASRTFAT
ncbi:hypothetical protein F5Y16DRAFT_380209 [Xylariaceae sp. FL0255]|nr:hypothetical protein F5Y16DRAFT_380209 [Xylariaceae sp. FL0255]